jgi:hypothetical protein
VDLAVVYSRQIDGNVLKLTPSGWTYGQDKFNSTFVLMDKETESLWFPAGEEGCTLPLEPVANSGCGLVSISGIYADKVLNGDFLSVTTWAEWKSLHADTKFVTD